MTPAKRLTDICLALMLCIFLLPLILILSLIILIKDGRPVFYFSERMKTPDQPFCLWKFRTMRIVKSDSGVSAGYKTDRITALGTSLRRHRLDELPQLLNILRGDMSFVGPRPPLRGYVEECPEVYAEVLKNRPGVTGLATLSFHRMEERLLAACKSPDETHDLYVRRCIPKKAQLDLIWARNRSLCYDMRLVFETAFRFISRKPRR